MNSLEVFYLEKKIFFLKKIIFLTAISIYSKCYLKSMLPQSSLLQWNYKLVDAEELSMVA